MDKKQVTKINNERLPKWQAMMERSNATAQVLIGVGHGEFEGRIVAMIPENIKTEDVRTILLSVLANLP